MNLWIITVLPLGLDITWFICSPSFRTCRDSLINWLTPLDYCVHVYSFLTYFSQLIKLTKVHFDQLNPLNVLNSPSISKWSKDSWSLDRASPYAQGVLDTRSQDFNQNSKTKIQEFMQLNSDKTRHDYYSRTTKVKFNTCQTWVKLCAMNLKQYRMNESG